VSQAQLDPITRGTCAGYEIVSSQPFQTLRTGGTGSPLYVDERPDLEFDGEVLVAWRPRPGNPFHGRLIRVGDAFAFWTSDAGWYLIDPATPRITMSPAPIPLRREVRLFGVPASICSLARGDVTIHAAAVEIAGGAVLLAGPSRYGKTTLAAALAQAGHRLLCEDSTRCSTNDGPRVLPGPAVLRLRADVAGSIDLPGRRVGIGDDGRVGVILDEGIRGAGDPVPLRAIVFLRSGPGPATLVRARPPDAIRDLLALTFQLPTPASRAAAFTSVTDLAAGVATYDLSRRIETDATREVVGLLERLAGTDG
jgi:hypothetical protein